MNIKLPYNPKLKDRARDLRKAGNISEVIFWNSIKNRKLEGLDFDRQKIIGNYIVDFYIPRYRIVIEIDGSSHDGKIDYDKERDVFMRGLSLKVLRFSDLDVKYNLDHVHKSILDEIIKTTPP